MKKISSFFIIGLLAILFEDCTQENMEAPLLQTVQFVLASADRGSETFLSTLSPGAKALVTVETTCGELLVTEHPLKLTSTAAGYLTEPLHLPPGGYVVSSFVVVGEDLKALYIASDRVAGTVSESETRSSTQMVMHLMPCHGFPPGKGRLKEFVFRDRHYNFFYNWRGAVDSIVATDVHNNYVYRVVYTRGRIDSVGIYDHGQYVSVNKDFTYNHRGQILSYNYFLNIPDRSPAFPVEIQYDYRGRVVAIGGNTLRYDRFDNVTSFQNTVENFTYTFEWGKNPLRAIDDLSVIMVEERWIWQYVFSKHNTLTRTDDKGVPFYFNNVYDSKGRLVSNGEMLFSYY